MNSQKSVKNSTLKKRLDFSRCRRKVKWRWKKLFRAELWASPKGFGIAAGLISVMWVANFFVMPALFSTANAGAAGDMFGGLTALFSGLAFAGLITTLFMQRKELSLQRNEIRLQRQELSQTREVFQIQRFEHTFFGLLNLLQEHVSSISYGRGDNRTFGRHALVHLALELPAFSEREHNIVLDSPMVSRSLEQIRVSYEGNYFEKFEQDLGPYFRLIYNILRHIEHTELAKNKQENERLQLVYSKILRSHLNSSEVKLLMFNCAFVHGIGLKGWVEKHSMLKHITRRDYEIFKEIVDLFEPIAFRFEERKVSEAT